MATVTVSRVFKGLNSFNQFYFQLMLLDFGVLCGVAVNVEEGRGGEGCNFYLFSFLILTDYLKVSFE